MSQMRPDKPATTSHRPTRGVGLHLDPLVSATWLYYEDQMTQSEIAGLLGVSRATVISYLREARRNGVVKITIANEHFATMKLAQQIRVGYGLDQCIVIPDDQGRRPVAQRVGEAGARLLSTLITPGDMLGVSWGQTVLALSHAVVRQQIADLSVIQITGSMMATYAFSPELCTSNIADRFSARCINLHAPALVSSAVVKRLLYDEPALKPQLALLQTCTKLVFGVGNLNKDSTIFDSGVVTHAAAQAYLKKGAEAVIAGRFIDGKGKPIHGELDDRMIGLTMDEIDRIPTRICVAGGASKIEAVRAALIGKHATILVTDELNAKGLAADLLS
jgi:DNA-binding transcriptional regulator LsrR (DeoR family)